MRKNGKENANERNENPQNSKAKKKERKRNMEPVRGVGDEAFWAAGPVGGALYVLKRDRFIRISVGGKGDNQTKLRKSKTLAQKALKPLGVCLIGYCSCCFLQNFGGFSVLFGLSYRRVKM